MTPFEQYSASHSPNPGEEFYLPSQDLADAVNVALLIGQPLLVTGEPGTGKTRLAYSVASQMGLSQPLRFNTKSNSSAQELFYHYDALGHFRANQAVGGSEKPPPDVHRYLRCEAMGAAILRTLPAAHPNRQALLNGNSGAVENPVRSVVLIDEIDKAPRDFPNDILNEIEHLEFAIPELEGAPFKIADDPALRPVVIITSNSEKHLPDAFLRRCIFASIDFPDEKRLEQIVALHYANSNALRDPLIQDALSFFLSLRHAGARRFEKLPATAELIAWVGALAGVHTGDGSLRAHPEAVRKTLGVLVKSSGDREAAEAMLQDWAG